MRSKEDAKDYRYFPDPDLPPVFIGDTWIQEIKDRQPEFKTGKMARYQAELGLSNMMRISLQDQSAWRIF